MAKKPVSVVDTNVLLNLPTPVVETRPTARRAQTRSKHSSLPDDVHAPASVVCERTAATRREDLLAAAAELVWNASHQMTVHEVENQLADPLKYRLDQGEAEAIWLATDLAADLFITDEFNSTNYLFITLALEDRNTLFTTSHILCTLAQREILSTGYVDRVLTYDIETKDWNEQYIDHLRRRYLRD